MRSTVHGSAAASEGGFVTAEWMAAFALLVVPVLVVVVTVPSWAARHEAVAAAGRAAARAAVRAGDAAAADRAALLAARAVLAERGHDGDAAAIEVALPAGPGGRLPRAGMVTVTVTLPGTRVVVPFLGPVDGPVVRGAHRRALDPLRGR